MRIRNVHMLRFHILYLHVILVQFFCERPLKVALLGKKWVKSEYSSHRREDLASYPVALFPVQVEALCRGGRRGGGERGGGLNASSSSAAPLHQGGEGGPDAQLDLLLVRGVAVAVACKLRLGLIITMGIWHVELIFGLCKLCIKTMLNFRRATRFLHNFFSLFWKRVEILFFNENQRQVL